MPRFYKPQGARLGDTIPFFWDGEFHVFYLKRVADDTHDRIETDWNHISTATFADYRDHGVAIPRGTDDDPDFSAATGSVIRVGDEFHAYYTGFRKWDGDTAAGRHQSVLRARSKDLKSWEKDKDFSLLADSRWFDANEWRDPFVYAEPDGSGYRMLIAGQAKTGPKFRRGVTVQATSIDSVTWSVAESPFWSPGLYSMHECPDVFQMGDWWYLIYSTLTDRTVTRYRMSRTVDGPWVAPADDELDGLGLYAAKSASDGQNRYLFGWCTNNVAGRDGGDWLWGGNLVVHQLAQQSDGRLLVQQPEIRRSALMSQLIDRTEIGFRSITGSHGYVTSTLAQMPHSGFIDLALLPEQGTKSFGLELRATSDRAHGYSISFQPDLGRVVVDRLDRFGADRPYDIRPFTSSVEELHLTLEFEGEISVLYVNGERAITLRGYDQTGSELGIFVIEGEVKCSSTTMFTTMQEAGTGE